MPRAGVRSGKRARRRFSQLPPTRMSDDTVVWETEVVFVSPEEEDFHQGLWIEADEQHLPVEVTRRLAEAGFRSGLLGMPLPVVLSQRLDRQPSGPAGQPAATPLSELPAALSRRHLQARARQRYEIVVPEVHDELVAEWTEGGDTCQEHFLQAQCVLALQSVPQGDGRVKLQITPEIQYGAARQHITVRDGMFQVESKRDSKVFDHLRFEATVSPGQTLVLTHRGREAGLGESSSPKRSGASLGSGCCWCAWCRRNTTTGSPQSGRNGCRWFRPDRPQRGTARRARVQMRVPSRSRKTAGV